MILFFDPSWAPMDLLVTGGLTPLTQHVRLARVLALPESRWISQCRPGTGACPCHSFGAQRLFDKLRADSGRLNSANAGCHRGLRWEFGPASGSAGAFL